MTTELEVYEGEIVAEPLTKRAAQALDKKIRTASDKLTGTVDSLYELLEQAAVGQIHRVLEYPSWTAWMKDAVQFTPSDRVERKLVVALMSGKGMSQRAIAATLGVSQKTVDRDLDGVESGDSTVVTTTAGKTYPKNKQAPVAEDEQEPLEAEIVEEGDAPRTVNDVAGEFRTETDNVGIDIQALKDIMDYDEFEKASKTVANRYLNKLGEHVSELQKIIDQLMAG